MGQKAPVVTVRLLGREPDEGSMSSSESESEDDDVGESSGVELGVEFQKLRGGWKVFFLSMAQVFAALKRREKFGGEPKVRPLNDDQNPE